jgi:hypothetical protein
MCGIGWALPSSGESVISVTSTRPAVLIDSIRAGARDYVVLAKTLLNRNQRCTYK